MRKMLADLREAKEPEMKIERVHKFARQFMSGLKFLHSKGVAHGDMHGIVIISSEGSLAQS